MVSKSGSRYAYHGETGSYIMCVRGHACHVVRFLEEVLGLPGAAPLKQLEDLKTETQLLKLIEKVPL